MEQLKRLIREIHRRSLWQVLLIYVGAAWACYEIIDTITDRLLLPEWLPVMAIVLFLVGLPVVLATAFVQEGLTSEGQRDGASQSGVETETPRATIGAGIARRLLTWRNALLGGVLAFALWGVVAAGWFLLQGRQESELAGDGPPVSPTRIAVLPFAVRGSAEFDYLGEGMVDLLSTKLDGAGDLRSVDARALLGAWGRDRGAPNPVDARRIAQRFDAGLFVLGNILEVEGRLRIDASLYDASRGADVVARATAESEADGIFEAVDELAARLLGGRSGERGERMTEIAAVTTHSLPALKAYLKGEQEFREGAFGSALEAFRRATRIDSTFALAYYRLSIAAEWHLAPGDVVRRAAEQAVRFGDRLSDHDQMLLHAFLATRRGDAAEAERRYRVIVSTYPEDVEAWLQLGEVLFHYGPLRGHPIAESREPWEKVLELDAQNVTAPVHLGRIAAREGDAAKLEAMVQRLLRLNPQAERALEMPALQAFAFDDTAAQRRVVAELRTADVTELPLTVWSVATYSGNVRGARKLASLMVEPSRPTDLRGLGHVWLAHLELALGHWSRAQEELYAAERLAPSALEYRTLLSLAPFLPVTGPELATLREQLSEWDAETVSPAAIPSVWITVHEGLHGNLRTYLLGLLSARLGDLEAARAHAAALERARAPARARSLLPDLARGVRAEIARQRGRPDEALAALERVETEAWYNLAHASGFVSQMYGRYVRAALLQELGRAEDALRWYGSFAGHSVYDLAFLAPSHLRRAEIYERRGDRERAGRHYARFVELWSGADPELQRLVEYARRRLARLTGEPVSGG